MALTLGGSYIQLPTGTTAQRPSVPSVGMMRYNTDSTAYEVYKSTGWSDVDLDLSSGTQFNVTSQTHGIWNPPGATTSLISGGSTNISTYGAAAASVAAGSTFGIHGMHSGSSAYPGYWAVYMGNPKRAINRLVISLHANSVGYFALDGSNDCGSAAGFANNGTWTRLTLTSSNNGYNNENMGGWSSGLSDNTQFTYNYSNNTGYLAYRIRVLDTSNRNQTIYTTYGGGLASYWWRLDRA